MSATVKLIRGANASLSDLVPILGTIVIGFGWRIVAANGPQTELVPSAIVCGSNGQALSDEHLVFFNQLATPEGAVQYVGGGDEEQIELDLPTVPPEVDRIVFVVYADPDLRRPGTWGSVRSTYVRVLDRSGTEIVRYDVEPGIEPDVTALVLAEVYRHRGSWKIRAVGQGYASGILGVAGDFGVTV